MDTIDQLLASPKCKKTCLQDWRGSIRCEQDLHLFEFFSTLETAVFYPKRNALILIRNNGRDYVVESYQGPSYRVYPPEVISGSSILLAVPQPLYLESAAYGDDYPVYLRWGNILWELRDHSFLLYSLIGSVHFPDHQVYTKLDIDNVKLHTNNGAKVVSTKIQKMKRRAKSWIQKQALLVGLCQI